MSDMEDRTSPENTTGTPLECLWNIASLTPTYNSPINMYLVTAVVSTRAYMDNRNNQE